TSGGVYDSKFARAISGGAMASGSRFSLVAHSDWCYSGTNHNTSGVSEVIGQDFVVSVASTPVLTSPTLKPDVINAGTFIPELGHNLNLGHGGPPGPAPPRVQGIDPCPSCNPRPNHVSAMGYASQAIAGEGPEESVSITAIKIEYKGFTREPDQP